MIFKETKAKKKSISAIPKQKVFDRKKYHYIIGIDPGVNTGWASWSRVTNALLVCDSMSIHKAMNKVLKAIELYDAKETILVRVEDPRKRTWFGNADARQMRSGAGIREGVGSVKRDAKIWEDFLTDLGIDFEMVAPKNSKTKINSEYFKNITGWQLKTNEHSRDAAMLVYGF